MDGYVGGPDAKHGCGGRAHQANDFSPQMMHLLLTGTLTFRNEPGHKLLRRLPVQEDIEEQMILENDDKTVAAAAITSRSSVSVARPFLFFAIVCTKAKASKAISATTCGNYEYIPDYYVIIDIIVAVIDIIVAVAAIILVEPFMFISCCMVWLWSKSSSTRTTSSSSTSPPTATTTRRRSSTTQTFDLSDQERARHLEQMVRERNNTIQEINVHTTFNFVKMFADYTRQLFEARESDSRTQSSGETARLNRLWRTRTQSWQVCVANSMIEKAS